RDEAQIAQKTEERVVAFLINLFEAADPTETGGEELTVRQVFDAGAEKLEALVKEDAVLGGRVALTQANVYENLGLYEEASVLYRRGFEISSALPDPDQILLSRALRGEAGILTRQGQFDESVVLLERAIQHARHSGDAATLGASLGTRGYVAQTSQDLETCIPIYREAIAIQRELEDQTDGNLIKSLIGLGICLDLMERDEEAEATYNQAIGKAAREPEAFKHLSALAYGNLAAFFDSRDRPDEARDAYKTAIRLAEAVHGDDHPSTLAHVGNLAMSEWDAGRYSEAIRVSVDIAKKLRASAGTDNDLVLGLICNLGVYYRVRGDLDEASFAASQCLEGTERVFGPSHVRAHRARLIQAEVWVNSGRISSAHELIQLTISAARDDEALAQQLGSWLDQIQCRRLLVDGLPEEATRFCKGRHSSAVEEHGSSSAEDYSWQTFLLEAEVASGALLTAEERVTSLLELESRIASDLTPYFRCRLARLRGDLARAQGNRRDAAARYQEALDIGIQADFRPAQLDVSRALEGLSGLGESTSYQVP
ncbi:MAG: tetratricopeptide repeat protein, partial [Acidobacteriota bacterium]